MEIKKNCLFITSLAISALYDKEITARMSAVRRPDNGWIHFNSLLRKFTSRIGICLKDIDTCAVHILHFCCRNIPRCLLMIGKFP